jgi:hypothetical protein
VPVLGYYHKSCDLLSMWSIKALNAFKSAMDTTNGLISHIWTEVYGCIVFALPVLLEFYGGSALQPFFEVFGFTVKNSAEKFWNFWNDPGRGIPGSGQGLTIYVRLLVLLSSPALVSREKNWQASCDSTSRFSNLKSYSESGEKRQGSDAFKLNSSPPSASSAIQGSKANSSGSSFSLNESEGEGGGGGGEVVDLSWIPTPSALIELDKEYFLLKRSGVGCATLFGLRVFLAMDKYEEALEIANLGLANTLKSNVKVSCHCALGRIAFSQGRKMDALAQYEKASQIASESPLRYLSMQVEKDKKQWMAVQ